MDNMIELLIGAGFLIVMSIVGNLSKKKGAARKSNLPEMPEEFPTASERENFPNHEEDYKAKDVFTHNYFTYETIQEQPIKTKKVSSSIKESAVELDEEKRIPFEKFDLREAIIYSEILNNPYR